MSTIAAAPALENFHGEHIRTHWFPLPRFRDMCVTRAACSRWRLLPGQERRIVRSPSDECVHNPGYGRPEIVLALQDEVGGSGRAILPGRIHAGGQEAAAPLTATEVQCEAFIKAIREVADLANRSTSFWSEAIGLARRAINR
jgi:hypothetical protein